MSQDHYTYDMISSGRFDSEYVKIPVRNTETIYTEQSLKNENILYITQKQDVYKAIQNLFSIS